jgi:hypothetical protein
MDQGVEGAIAQQEATLPIINGLVAVLLKQSLSCSQGALRSRPTQAPPLAYVGAESLSSVRGNVFSHFDWRLVWPPHVSLDEAVNQDLSEQLVVPLGQR